MRDDRNPYDISFCPATLEEGRHFDQLLSVELSYRGVATDGTIRSKRESLHAAIEAKTLYNLMSKLAASTGIDSEFCAVEDAIPCIMHGGNHVGEKIFMMLLLELWSKCVSNADRLAVIEAVKNFVNRGVFGTEDSRSQWKLPINNKSEIEQVIFTAWREKKKWQSCLILLKCSFKIWIMNACGSGKTCLPSTFMLFGWCFNTKIFEMKKLRNFKT